MFDHRIDHRAGQKAAQIVRRHVDRRMSSTISDKPADRSRQDGDTRAWKRRCPGVDHDQRISVGRWAVSASMSSSCFSFVSWSILSAVDSAAGGASAVGGAAVDATSGGGGATAGACCAAACAFAAPAFAPALPATYAVPPTTAAVLKARLLKGILRPHFRAPISASSGDGNRPCFFEFPELRVVCSSCCCFARAHSLMRSVLNT